MIGVSGTKIAFFMLMPKVAKYLYITARSISPRSVQLSPMGSELSWGLLADQSESRKFLCPNMELLCAALKSAAKIHVQCFAKMYRSVSRLCVQFVAQFPATFRKSPFHVKKRIFMRNDSFQTFIDVSSFIITSGGFQVVVEGGNFKFT